MYKGRGMKKVVVCSLALSVMCMKAVIMDESRLITASMKDFVLSFVPASEQIQYVNYYQEFSKLFEKENAKKQTAARAALFEKAMGYLEHHNTNTYDYVANRIHQLRSNKAHQKTELENIERFLVRVGVYADFAELKVLSADLKRLKAFADDSFVDFLRRVVSPQNQVGFTNYYERLSAKINTCDKHKQEVTFQYLFGKALSDLEVSHADWHALLLPYGSLENKSTDAVANHARIFLRRYGAYQEYLELTGQANNGFFDTISKVCSNAGKTIAGWFGLQSV